MLATTMIQGGRRDGVGDHVAGKHRLTEHQNRSPGQFPSGVSPVRGMELGQPLQVFVDETESPATMEPPDRHEKVVQRLPTRSGLREPGQPGQGPPDPLVQGPRRCSTARN